MTQEQDDKSLIVEIDVKSLMIDLIKSADTHVGAAITGEVLETLGVSPVNCNLEMECMPPIKGAVAYGMTDTAYMLKLANLDNLPKSPEQIKRQQQQRFAINLTDDEVMQFAKELLPNLRIAGAIPRDILTAEIERRGLKVDLTQPANFKTIKKGDCCDGDMFEFGNGAEVCVTPPSFTEIDELRGDIICLNKAPADKKLPGELRIMGDGVESTYFNRKAIPVWLYTLIRENIKNDPATAETRKTLWAQMQKSVTKRPRKKKDGTSRASLSELHLSDAERRKVAREWKKEFKDSLAKTQKILRQHNEESTKK